jgi:histidinol phosphatase-like PHP family hydrolase
MNWSLVDLHFHTKLSDWRSENSEIIAKAKEDLPMALIATDHDFINTEFTQLAKDNGILTAEWVEASILDDRESYLHVNMYAKKFNWEIFAVLENTRNWRRNKIYKQIALLKNNWIEIDEDKFATFFNDKGLNTFNLNIYHLASYVYSIPGNIERIRRVTWVRMTDKVEFLRRCLRNEWDFAHIGSAWIPEYTPSTKKIASLSKENNWIISLAHPNFAFPIKTFDKSLKRLLVKGISAVEINTCATKEWVDKILQLHSKYGFMITFWSDCHFTSYKEEEHWRFCEINEFVPPEIIENNVNRLFNHLNR